MFWLIIIAGLQVAVLLVLIDGLEKLKVIIMATQKELVQQLTDIATGLTAANAEITKVSGETDTLLAKITELQNQVNNLPDASAELVAAVQAVADQAGVVSTGIAAVDAKVPDAPTP